MNDYTHAAINLFGVIVLMFVMSYVFKKIKFTKFKPNQQIKIMNSVSVGAREKIILVEVNGMHLLIGSTPNNITKLHIFNETEAKSSANHVLKMVDLTGSHGLDKEILSNHVRMD